MTVPKRCLDCKHHDYDERDLLLAKIAVEVCDVIPDTTCGMARKDHDMCGIDAKWFEPKEDK